MQDEIDRLARYNPFINRKQNKITQFKDVKSNTVGV